MNCYDHVLDGQALPAVAVCTCCGAAVCREHLAESRGELIMAATLGNPSVRGPVRRLVCLPCHAAGLGEMSRDRLARAEMSVLAGS